MSKCTFELATSIYHDIYITLCMRHKSRCLSVMFQIMSKQLFYKIYFWFKYNLDRSTMNPKFDPTEV